MSHASNIGRHARRGAKQMRSAARRMRNTAEEEGNGMMHTFQQMGGEAIDAVKDGYEGVRNTAQEYVDQGRARVGSLEQSFERQVQQRPVSSIFAALGVGFLAGLLFCRR